MAEKLYLTPPPCVHTKKNTASGIISTEHDYVHLISSCYCLCKNYARLLYVYNHLLGEYRDIVTHNRDIVVQCLSHYKTPPPIAEKKGEFTRYLSEQGFEPQIKEEDC